VVQQLHFFAIDTAILCGKMQIIIIRKGYISPDSLRQGFPVRRELLA
jgi:hypothetical protein